MDYFGVTTLWCVSCFISSWIRKHKLAWKLCRVIFNSYYTVHSHSRFSLYTQTYHVDYYQYVASYIRNISHYPSDRSSLLEISETREKKRERNARLQCSFPGNGRNTYGLPTYIYNIVFIILSTIWIYSYIERCQCLCIILKYVSYV